MPPYEELYKQIADLEQAIIHLDTHDSAVRVDDANLAMFYRPPGAVSQIPTSFGLQLV